MSFFLKGQFIFIRENTFVYFEVKITTDEFIYEKKTLDFSKNYWMEMNVNSWSHRNENSIWIVTWTCNALLKLKLISKIMKERKIYWNTLQIRFNSWSAKSIKFIPEISENQLVIINNSRWQHQDGSKNYAKQDNIYYG